jgi:biopolymer transport protein TolQ
MELTSPVSEHSLSMWQLFHQADWVVKGVIFTLLFASLWSWAIMAAKMKTLYTLKRRAHQTEALFSEALLDQMDRRLSDGCPLAHLVYMTHNEYKKVKTAASLDNRQWIFQRLEYVLNNYVEQKANELEDKLSVLEAISSTAPFVALFGTVWGIMNSFQSIAASKNTSLAIVAPGIAEALFATAIGFLVAIPASLGHNRLGAALEAYHQRMQGFANRLCIACMRG